MDEQVIVEATETTEPKKAGGRGIMLTLADGTQITRKEYCVKRANEGATRAQIAEELTELQGKVVPFQIVFAATRHLTDVFPKRVPKVKETVVVGDEVAVEVEVLAE